MHTNRLHYFDIVYFFGNGAMYLSLHFSRVAIVKAITSKAKERGGKSL